MSKIGSVTELPIGHAGENWSEQEVLIAVQAYFEHLAKEIRGESFVKTEIYRSLSALTGRTPKSIEAKFQNISAVLDILGREWMTGLRPLKNYQRLLADVVASQIQTLETLPLLPLSPSGLSEAPSLMLEQPPTLSALALDVPDYIAALVKKFDPVERDLHNRALGRAGEELILNHQRQFLTGAGYQDLAKNVRWISDLDGDGAGYDILSFTPKGEKRYIEVKTTTGWRETPFFVSRNEREFCKNNTENYSLIRLYDFRRKVRGFEMLGELSRHVNLSTEIYRAEF